MKPLVLKSSIVSLLCPYDIDLISETNLSTAPAQHLLEYYPVIFSKGFGNETTIYQASPSDMVDNVWTELYNSILSFCCIHGTYPYSSRLIL